MELWVVFLSTAARWRVLKCANSSMWASRLECIHSWNLTTRLDATYRNSQLGPEWQTHGKPRLLRFSSPVSNSNSMKINHLDPAHLSAQIWFTSTWQRPKGKLVQGHAELGDVEKGLQQRVHIAGRLGKKWRSSQRSLGKSPRESISIKWLRWI